jgi:hypothetical protein
MSQLQDSSSQSLWQRALASCQFINDLAWNRADLLRECPQRLDFYNQSDFIVMFGWMVNT